MNEQKSLQKFTDLAINVQSILELQTITYDDLKQLTTEEHKQLETAINERLEALQGEEKTEFLSKIEPILTKTSKNQIWENNHNSITWAITSLINEYGCMPTKTAIAKKANLSRPTVDKHLKEYSLNPLYIEQLEQFKFMSNKVLAKMFQLALNGDVAAAKLYFKMVGNTLSNNLATPTTQNNYIQINNTILSQEAIEHLNPEEKQTIETILLKAKNDFN